MDLSAIPDHQQKESSLQRPSSAPWRPLAVLSTVSLGTRLLPAAVQMEVAPRLPGQGGPCPRRGGWGRARRRVALTLGSLRPARWPPSCAPCWTCPSVIYTLPLTVFSSPEALTPVSPATERPVAVPRCVFLKMRFCLIRHP